VCATGAAIDVISDLLRLPGASAKVTGGHVPYHRSQVEELMGYAPERAVSEETAVGLAQASYLAAQRIAVLSGEFGGSQSPQVIGLGITGAVATSRERRGLDHVWIAVRTLSGIKTGHFVFDKGAHENARAAQNELAGVIALNALAAEVGASQHTGTLLDKVKAERGEVSERGLSLSACSRPLLGCEEPLLITPDGEVESLASLRSDEVLIYPGSFRSFHCGHDLAALNACRVSGKRVVFEISAVNADKAPIEAREISRRVEQFYGRHPVIVTPDSPLFVDKSRAYPKGMGFVVGYDTAERLLDPRFYRDEKHLAESLATFRERGNTFYVIGRASKGEYKTILDLPGYEENRDLFRQLMGQLDISATAIAKASL
jgi:nicotinamide mononucleotide (NMN) deamidase PncC